uniref:Alcohol dehydrogenase 6 n=1 Tax=Anabas testudineus TaxID=64144 RepID=A0A7N6C175_ANATE
ANPASQISSDSHIVTITCIILFKVIKCKAAVAWEPGKPLTIQDVDVAPPKVHEVRIKIVATGVCHTDWEYLYESGKGMKSRPFPLVLGHEAAGIVESVGPEVTKFSPGDKVIPLFLPQCGECERCRSPKTNQCRKNWANMQLGVMADGTSRISYKNQQLYQFLGVSSFSQYTVVPDTSLTKIRCDAPLDKVCLLGCGVSTGYGAAVKTAKVEKDSSCAVFGLGAVGLAAVMGCQVAGAKRIIGVDINPDKFEKARVFGATECINPRDHEKAIQEVLVEKTGGGVDYALECVGSPVIMNAALESTAEAWGTCVIAGWTETETMNIMVEKILMGRTLKGTYFGGWKSVEDVPKLVDDYMNKKLKLDEFITHNLTLDQINVAFDLLKSGKSIRTVISL